MKKLMCLLLLTTMIVGCSSNDSKGKAKPNEKTSVNEKLKDSKKDDEQKEKEDKEDEKENNSDDVSNDSVSNDKKTSADANSQTSDKKEQSSSNYSSNGNSQSSSTPSQKPSQPDPTPEPKPTPVPEKPTEQRAKADAVMAQINSYRQQKGLAPFTVTSYLLTNSSNHSYAMADARALWHSGAAECITNYDDPFNAWVNSSEHNEMLLCNNRYGAVSIYYADGYYFSVFQTSP